MGVSSLQEDIPLLLFLCVTVLAHSGLQLGLDLEVAEEDQEPEADQAHQARPVGRQLRRQKVPSPRNRFEVKLMENPEEANNPIEIVTL